jgi:hypothetical protein
MSIISINAKLATSAMVARVAVHARHLLLVVSVLHELLPKSN